jgi:5-methyltetrahydropteroyltriglutamate--homocysteine methyltransferase
MKEIMGDSRDRRDFARFYAAQAALRGTRGPLAFPVNVGPIRYSGHALVQRDIDNFKAALGSLAVSDAYLSSVFTGVQVGTSEHYRSKDEQAVAVAEAMREEYAAIVRAGLNVQIDDPILVNVYEFRYSVDRDFAGFRKWAQSHVELVNHALEGIPEERIRYHLCWGSWIGPHSADLPLSVVIDLLLKIKASQYSFEAANPQHEHEWKLWQDDTLPEGKALIPGVVTHKTTILEHPEVVADRIVRYAQAVGRENVIAGTDCGFGGRIDPDVAWAKLEALAAGAALATEQLW